MGPTIVLDKSAYEALSVRELNILRRYYYVNLPPVLFSEILADLTKYPKEPGRAEKAVAALAGKHSPIDTMVSVAHNQLAYSSLMGGLTPGDRRPVVASKMVVTEEGEKGALIEENDIERALHHWRAGHFDQLEKLQAKIWRKDTKSIDLEELKREIKKSGHTISKTASLVEIRDSVKADLDAAKPQFELVSGFMTSIGLDSRRRACVAVRWVRSPVSTVREFASYARDFITITQTFNLALAHDLIGTRATNLVDLQYVYYAPFCHVFVSGDKFHETFVPAFLSEDQEFVRSDVLKEDLRAIADHWDSLNDEEQEEYSHNRGNYPPELESSLTDRMWKKHMKPWDPEGRNAFNDMSEEEKEEWSRKIKLRMDALQEGSS